MTNKVLSLLLTPAEIDLITSHTFYEDRDKLIGEVKGSKVRIRMTLDDIEHLAGHIAAAANHEDNSRLQRKLDRLSDKVEACIERCSGQ
ncbi:MAG TPA: hypothetical protein PK014_03355 [Thermoanaerobaculia bacterium]|nr:hypothetical protein [Thermoanaerobaculia bacterium]HUM29188.1 hypothetical protein [Thermoanaerobaculia bacterium]HXK67567.1 hypothetical protein [Thermoanaerobaculia bacterium]